MRAERQRYKRLLEQKDMMLRAERRACERRACALTGLLRDIERSYREVDIRTKSLHIQQRSTRRGQAGELYFQFQNIDRSVRQREQIAAQRKEISERLADVGAKIRSQSKLGEIVGERLGKVEILQREDSKGIESQKILGSALRRKLADLGSQVEGKEGDYLRSERSYRENCIQPAQVVSEILRTLTTLHAFQDQGAQVGGSTAACNYPTAKFSNQGPISSPSQPNISCQYQLASSREYVDIVATLIAPGQVQVHLITSGNASSKLIRTAQHRLRQLFTGINSIQVSFSVEERENSESHSAANLS